MELQKYNPLLSPKIRRHSWVVLLGATLFACYSYFQLARTPSSYRSVGKMYVSGRVILAETPTTFSEEFSNYLGTQIEIMRSQEIHNRSIQRMALSGISVDSSANLIIDMVEKTTIFELRCESGDPIYSKHYLDAIMHEYIEFKRDKRLAVSQNTVEQISSEILRLEGELDKHEQAFFRFRENNNIGVWEQQSAASASFLNELKGRQGNLKLKLSLLENWLNISKREALRVDSQNLVSGLVDVWGEVESTESQNLLRGELERLQVERDLKSRVLKPSHPLLKELEREIEIRTRLEKISTDNVVKTREEIRWALTAELAGLANAIQDWEEKALESSRIEAQYQKLRDARDRTKDLYDRMLVSLRNIDVGTQVNQELVQILQAAGTASPIKPEFRKTVIQGLFYGGILGWVIMLLLVRTDDSSYDIESAVQVLGVAGLGEIPAFKARNSLTRRGRYEKAAFEESFRRLRSLIHDPSRTEPNVMLVTSSLASEGKTEITVQLGKIFAAAGQKVLLIDADLRRGRLRKIFPEIDENANGFCEFLTDSLSGEDVIVNTRTENLFIVPRGSESKNAGELFSKHRVNSRVSELVQGFDIVLIDSAPVGPVDDSTQLLSVADRIVFVIRSGSTHLNAASQNLDRLKAMGAKNLQIVLNRVKGRMSSKYYSYYR